MDLTIKNVPEELEARIRKDVERTVTMYFERKKVFVVTNEPQIKASIEEFKSANAAETIESLATVKE